MTDRAEVLALFGRLEQEGFLRKGLVWNRASPETVFLFEVKKSSYSRLYSLYAGISFVRLGAGAFLHPNKGDYYGGIGSDEVERALNFDLEYDDRKGQIALFLSSVLLPAADKCASEAGAIQFVKSNVLVVPLVAPRARALLGFPAPAE